MMRRRLICLVLILGCLAFGLWYTRPMTVEELFPVIDLDRCSMIHGYYYLYDGSNGAGDDVRFEESCGSEVFSAVLASVESREFRRSLRSLLPAGSRSHRLEEGDFKWNLHFIFDGLDFPDGSTGSGAVLQFSNFFGQLELYCDGESLRCTAEDHDAWLWEVMGQISSDEKPVG